jgi:putative methionine-R-sulfoxide reductase with GAF domain
MTPALERRQTVDDRLEQIKAVTDTALAFLDVDDMLIELLDRVLEILDADTAAVLLVDTSGRDLVASAARGLEEEVRQGVRIPIGRGFAGRVAAEARPIILDRVDATTVSNPILWQKGIRSMLGVPLRSGDVVIGVLHVGTLGERRFGEDDIEVMQVVAERIAGAIHVRLFEADRDAAAALQRSLLPSAPPRLAELEFAARYVPAERGGIGGDWYDVFQLDSGDVWVVAGDVAGHGLRAAVVMGRIRSALRAYALLDIPPDEVLRLTSRKIDHFELGQMATCAIAVISPPYDTARVVLAGHPPVVVARPGVEPAFVDVTVGPPLGAGKGLPWPVSAISLEPGDVLFFYTDGLVERRHEMLDEGLERLRQAVTAEAPEVVCQQVMAAVVGRNEPQDDITILALRRSPLPPTDETGNLS